MMELLKGQLIIGTILVLLLCSPLVFTNTSMESNNIQFIEINDTVLSRRLSEQIILADLIEIEYMAINGNDELLQMAEDNNWPGNGLQGNPIIIEGYYFRNAVHSFVV